MRKKGNKVYQRFSSANLSRLFSGSVVAHHLNPLVSLSHSSVDAGACFVLTLHRLLQRKLPASSTAKAQISKR